MVRVLLADHQPAVRGAIRPLLERDGFEVCAEASDADAAIEAAIREKPDLCLVEVLLPGDGIRAASEIDAQVERTSVVMLTSSRETDHLVDSIRAGAVGYLLTDMDPDRIGAALQGVLGGEAAIPRVMVAALVRELQSRGEQRQLIGRRGPVLLTRREWEVIDLMRHGLSTAAIAQRLFLAPVTVRRHASSAVRKLGASDRADALEILAEGGIQTKRRRTA
jgi:two-component system NarL family response regulator